MTKVETVIAENDQRKATRIERNDPSGKTVHIFKLTEKAPCADGSIKEHIVSDEAARTNEEAVAWVNKDS